MSLANIQAMRALNMVKQVISYADGTNLFNPATRTVGYYIYENNGILASPNATYDTSDYIAVTSGQSYAITRCRKIVFFNTSKVFVSGMDIPSTTAQVVTAPVDGFIRVSFLAVDVNSSQIEKGLYGTTYQPYAKRMAIPIAMVDGLIQPTVSKNLFNPAVRSIGYYVDAGLGTLTGNALYDTTDYMAVNPSTSYAITTCRKIVYYNATKQFISGVDIVVPAPKVITTPSNCVFMKVTFQSGLIGTSQVEQGSVPTTVVPYGAGSGTYTLSPNVLVPSTSVSGLAVTNTIDFTNIDRIGFIGDSYTEALYPVRGKAYINKLSLFSDYNFENFAQSGDTYRGNIDRIRKKSTIYHNKLSWQDFKPKYAFLVSYTNDIKYMDANQYGNDLRAAVETVKSLGAIPIISTEYHVGSGNNTGVQNVMKQVAREYGADFVDITSKVDQLRGSDHADFWFGSHPGTRANALESDNYEKYLKQLPRPRQSIKVFRLRGGVTANTLDDLVFNTNVERATKFKEIMVGHSALVDNKYVDNLTNPAMTVTRVNSEYLMLQNKEAVSFTDYVLVSVVLPTSSRNIQSLSLYLSDASCNVYVKNIVATPYPVPTYYQRFDVNGTPTFNIGDTYTSADSAFAGKTFTVAEIDGSSIMMTPYVGGTGNPGTLTLVTGTGTASVTYGYTALGYSSSYPAGKQNIGHWQQLNLVNNMYQMPVNLIADAIDYDKVHFLVQKTGTFGLNDIHVVWSGSEDKAYRDLPLKLEEPQGAEMLAQNFVGTTAQLSGWTVEGTATPYTPADGVLPSGASGCIDVTTANHIKQTITYPNSIEDVEFEIKVWARYFPAIYDSTTDYNTYCQITEDSFDYASLGVDLVQGTQTYSLKDIVNLHWKEVTFRAYLPTGSTSQTIRVYSNDKAIQVAKVSVRKVISTQ